MRASALHALRKMMKKERKVGEMVGEIIEVKKMIEKMKKFVEGEKRGKREVEIEEVCGVIGEMIMCGVDVGEIDEMMQMVR